MKALLLVPVLLLAGCATDGKDYDAQLLDVQWRIASINTLTVDCPAGCKVSYSDPRDRAIGIKGRTNGWDVVNNVTNQLAHVATVAVVPAAMYGLGKAGFDALQGSGTVTTTNTSVITSTDNRAVDSHNIDDHSAVSTPTVVLQPPAQVVTNYVPYQVTP
jgi:hypothetical protein